MTINEQIEGDAVPFESATELRATHEALLTQIDKQLESDASEQSELAALARIEPDIRTFMARGASTGMFLEQVKDRTSCQVLLDYWVSALGRIGHEFAAPRLLRFDRSRLPDLTDKPCPYVGLEAFRNKTFFFGRVEDTRTLIEQVGAHPLTIVMGASGSGKSSLVMGGLLPAIKRGADGALWWRLRPFTPGDDVLGHMTRAFAGILKRQTGGAGSGESDLAGHPEQFAQAVLAAAPRPLIITIDQFEETFTLSTEVERMALANCLAVLLSAGKGHRAILTMREEFRSRIVALAPLEPYVGRAWYSVPPMGYADLREAIERPAGMVNLEFQSGIADDLAKKVLGQSAALPLLQFTLQRLWHARDRNRITREVYDRVGSPLDALKKTADEFYDGLAPETRDEVKRVLLALVRVDELLEAYRQPVRESSLLSAGKANTAGVLKLLADADYIRTIDGGANAEAVVEIKHEALIRNWPMLVGWIDEKRVERRRRLAVGESARRWADNGRPVEGLLTGWQLQEASQMTDRSSVEEEFVSSSAQAIDNAQRMLERRLKRRNATIIAGAFVVVLLVVGVSMLAIDRYRTISEGLAAEAASNRAEAERLQKERDVVVRDRDDISSQLAEISKKYADLFVRDLKLSAPKATPANAGAAARTTSPVRIFLHIASEAQRAQAQDIADKLRASKIEVPKGIQLVPEPPRNTEVRYFRQGDRAGAEEIARSLKTSLGVDDTDPPKLIAGYENTVPARQYELWFAPSAFAPKRKPPVLAPTPTPTPTATPTPILTPVPAPSAPAPQSQPAPQPVAQPSASVQQSPLQQPQLPHPAPVQIVGAVFLERRHYVELPRVFDEKPLWVYVNGDVDHGNKPTVIIIDKQPTTEDKGSDAHLFRLTYARRTKTVLDKSVGPEKFDEGFTYDSRKYRLVGNMVEGKGIQFDIRRE